MCLANGTVARYCQLKGLAYLNEGFVDRRYLDSGKLQPRAQANSVLHQTFEVLAQVKSIVTEQRVVTASGNLLSLKVDSLCLHGDHPDAINIAKGIRQLLDINDTEHAMGMDN